MNKFLTLVFFIVILSGCYKNGYKDTLNESNCYNKTNPPKNNHKATIVQGVWGDVWFWSGNFMPLGRGKICQVSRKVMVFESTQLDDTEKIGYSAFFSKVNIKLVKTINSDNDGFFQLELEPGNYSLFVWEDTKFYANRFSSDGTIFPIRVEPEKVSEVRFDITYEATF